MGAHDSVYDKTLFPNESNTDDRTVDLCLLNGDNISSNIDYGNSSADSNFIYLENYTTFSFLQDTENFKTTKGFLQQVGIRKRDLSLRKQEMYMIHSNVCAKLFRLSSLLSKEPNKYTVLKRL